MHGLDEQNMSDSIINDFCVKCLQLFPFIQFTKWVDDMLFQTNSGKSLSFLFFLEKAGDYFIYHQLPDIQRNF